MIDPSFIQPQMAASSISLDIFFRCGPPGFFFFCTRQTYDEGESRLAGKLHVLPGKLGHLLARGIACAGYMYMYVHLVSQSLLPEDGHLKLAAVLVDRKLPEQYNPPNLSAPIHQTTAPSYGVSTRCNTQYVYCNKMRDLDPFLPEVQEAPRPSALYGEVCARFSTYLADEVQSSIILL